MFLKTVGGDPETFAYDPLGRVVNHANDVGEFALSYLGQTNQMTSQQGANVGTAWTYDTNANDRRLISVGSGPGSRTFS